MITTVVDHKADQVDQSIIAVLVALIDHPAADDCCIFVCNVEFLNWRLACDSIYDNEVRELAFLDRAELIGPVEIQTLNNAQR